MCPSTKTKTSPFVGKFKMFTRFGGTPEFDQSNHVPFFRSNDSLFLVKYLPFSGHKHPFFRTIHLPGSGQIWGTIGGK